MKKLSFVSPSLLAGALGIALLTTGVQAADAPKQFEGVRTIDICTAYPDLKTDAEKTTYRTELERRGQLSVQDIENFPKNQVVNGSTACGMYMTLGKPLQEKGRQLRPMVFKVVHVYPEHYYVTQMGMVVEKHERKKGELPPKLFHETPAVQPPPVMFRSPGGAPVH